MSIVLATCAIAQEYGQAHALDDRLLLSALHQRGIEGRVAVWNDASFDWDRAEQVIIRSTWDYHLHGEQFLAWAEQVASLCPLWNPWHVVRWNADKRYLRQLAACGIAAIPTHWVAQGETAHLAQIMYEHDWQRVMLKPAMGLNAYGILEVDLRHLVEGQDHLDAHLRQHGMLVQQFFPSVTHLGERSLVWIAGIWSTFALRKRSLTRSNPLTSGDEELIEASSSELQFAQRVLSVTGQLLGLTAEDLLFARVDVVPDEQGPGVHATPPARRAIAVQ